MKKEESEHVTPGPIRVGDAIATVAQPIARGIDWIFGTNVAGCVGCKEMQRNLNAGMSFAGAIYDRFWSSKQTKQETEQMQFIITRQTAVEAETAEEAISKLAEGTTVSINVNARPQPGQPVQAGQTIIRSPATVQTG